jgi:hypothetical protein
LFSGLPCGNVSGWIKQSFTFAVARERGAAAGSSAVQRCDATTAGKGYNAGPKKITVLK